MLAVFGAVLPALFTTDFAHVRAQTADLLHEFRPARHFSSGERTDLGARTVQLNTANHHLNILLVQTGRGAVLARLHTLQTLLDALTIAFV